MAIVSKPQTDLYNLLWKAWIEIVRQADAPVSSFSVEAEDDVVNQVVTLSASFDGDLHTVQVGVKCPSSSIWEDAFMEAINLYGGRKHFEMGIAVRGNMVEYGPYYSVDLTDSSSLFSGKTRVSYHSRRSGSEPLGIDEFLKLLTRLGIAYRQGGMRDTRILVDESLPSRIIGVGVQANEFERLRRIYDVVVSSSGSHSSVRLMEAEIATIKSQRKWVDVTISLEGALNKLAGLEELLRRGMGCFGVALEWRVASYTCQGYAKSYTGATALEPGHQ